MTLWFLSSILVVWRAQFCRLKDTAMLMWRLGANQCGLLAAAGTLFSGLVGAVVLRAMSSGAGGDPSPPAMLLALVGGSLTTVAIFLFLHSRGSRPAPFSNRKVCPVPKAIWIGAIGLLLTWPLIQYASLIGGELQATFTGVEAPTIGHHFLETIREQGGSPVTWGLVATIVLLGPLAEELIWRGAVQQGLKQIGLPRVAAIFITAVAFAFFHWGAVPENGRAAAIPALAVLGVALGYLMERTGRIWASYAAHSLFNCANLFLFSMLPQ
ncbi:MAG: CPBP family intramembrane metalloprotease [Planctomycetes bacterium]|nr:CPBP family intramembrane metalloprotease [Planctomycetota bacterium]